MNDTALSPGVLSRRSAAIIAAYGLSMFLIGLGARELTRHEVLAAYPAKEMLRYGHWIVPMYAGIPRLLKPPTTSWFIAASMAICRSDAAWVARLPSVAAAMAVALLIAHLAARHFGDRAGLLTGLIQLTCYYMLNWGRLAEADIFLCAFATGAMVCFSLATVSVEPPHGAAPEGSDGANPRRAALRLGFFALTGLSFLAKGPIGLMFIFLAVAAFAVVRRGREIARFFWSPTGWLILLVCILGWPVAAWLSHPPIVEAWRREMSDTATGGFGTDPFYTYLHAIPFDLLPWTPLVIAGLWLLWKRGLFRRPAGQFFLCWFAPGFVALHLIAMKSHHYPMPLLPPFSIAAAVALLELARRLRRPLIAVVSVFAGLWVAVAGVQLLVIPRFDDFKPQADFARRAAVHVPAGQRIYIIDHPDRRTTLDDPRPRPEPYVAYHLRPPIWRFRNEKEFAAFAAGRLGQTGAAIYVVATEAQRRAIAPLGNITVLDRCAGLRRGETEMHRLLLLKIER